MNVFDLYPHGTSVVLFEDAYKLHQGAAGIYRLANSIPPVGQSREVAEQRKAILTIAAQLMVKQRDNLLDQFSRAWLRHRDLPIPTYEQPQGSSDVGGSSAAPPQDQVQAADRGQVSNAPSHDRSHPASAGVTGDTVP